ncbi:hypothetical protein M409DRAFT_61461 [Zasmidium cellare ATCC 36951]|uniref:Uncharacterized protein n=1 Tax=Zasmidium cellare ATCC 36951 TaxID=1080233 RepID=A0A6A6BXM6_ZASCE|nr:uncharacterized protein M409DRAFT_61461 [Zasmidium cellare ATCC 36951]KAF2158680.1 hypothetical protein M409DRAFT_61461 [Zasmidium cellare ATCC 36951]
MNARLDYGYNHYQYQHSLPPASTMTSGSTSKQNRKRIRHRPSRARKQELYTASQRSGTSPTTDNTPFKSKTMSTSGTMWSTNLPRLLRQESAESRERRIFGGEDGDTASAKALKGAMLDVVLGLFDGVDYEDGI